MIDLDAAIRDYRATKRTPFHALADNFDWEERVSPERRQAYQEHPARTGRNRFAEHHAAYVRKRIEVSDLLPETFAPVNGPAHRREPEKQRIVRLEAIDWVLDGEEFSIGKLAGWLTDLEKTGGKGSGDARAQAEDGLAAFFTHWNEKRDNRPSFAAFHDDVAADLEAADWPHALRNRLGLGHYDVTEGAAHRNVALMVYSVADVLKTLSGEERSRAFAVPTAFDGGHTPYFFPAPLNRGDPEESYGRTLDLVPHGDYNRLVAEFLHRRIVYQPKHLVRLGVISTAIPAASLKSQRNNHLECLRMLTVREDFGQAIPDDVED